MHTWLRHIWEALTASYWFVPTIMIAGAAGLAFLLLWIDRAVITDQTSFQTIYGGGAEGARALLSTIASSAITVAGVAFSITIAALTQASSQYGPRLLRNFMRDRGNQVVLGTLTATFVFAILVVRTIYGEEHQAFVPNLSVTVGVALSLASIAMLIYFIHHISHSLQAPVVVANAAAELRHAIVTSFPEGRNEKPRLHETPARPDTAQAALVSARAGGFLQAVDEDSLIELATSKKLLIWLESRPGHFVVQGQTLASLEPLRHVSEEVVKRVEKAFIIGRQTTAEQDIEFSVHQLVEIACRALSPGINDPITAMECIDWLGDCLTEAARRNEPATVRCDKDNQPRLVRQISTFEGLVAAAFNPIRQNAERSLPVAIRLVECMTAIAQQCRTVSQLSALQKQVAALEESLRTKAITDHDRDDINRRLHTFQTTRIQRLSRCSPESENDDVTIANGRNRRLAKAGDRT